MVTTQMDKILRSVLPLVQKPIRYTGGEYNLPIREKGPDSITFGLIFPDIYEVGMSNYGLKILYHLLHQDPSVIVERAYAPWPDFAALLKKNNIPLYSLETKTPLKDFHILGFSLQSELSYPTVLYILDLAGIPLRSEERKDSDPLIIAGGPCCVNPLPMVDFFDAFCIGDGEEVVREIVEVYRHSGLRNREEILSSLAKVEGIYVPSQNGNRARSIKKRTKRYLKEEEFPFPPIVPVCDTIHDRLAIEVMRGCTRGCRFCQAGIVNRPLRLRKPEEIIRLAERGIRSSGWEELSLLAFSVSDYPDLPDLLTQLNALLYKKRVAISLPSIRGEDFSLSLAQKLKAIKKTGLTFAPETISNRLKGVINKDIKEDKIFAALAAAADSGWLGVKLYFMIGLPTETEEDIQEIAKFVLTCARRFKKMQIRFSVSPFIPKPHTPLQWQPFSDIGVLQTKLEFLKRETKRSNVRLKWENPYQSQIQAILAQGDEKLGKVILSAYQKGAIFAEWSEFFNYQHWEESFQEAGLDFNSYLEKKAIDTPLPWDFIDVGVDKNFLRREALRAEKSIFTPDCRQSNCWECGVCSPEQRKEREDTSKRLELEIPTGYERKIFSAPNRKVTYRVKYAVGENFLFASHLDIVRQFYRALRRSELPVVFSSGFSPHPLISFGPPRPVGVSSRGEYLDIQIAASYSGNLTRDLAPFLPKGIMILETRVLHKKTDSLGKGINLAEYEIKPSLFQFLPPLHKIVKRGKEIPAIFRIDLNRESIVVLVAVAPGVRLFTVLSQLFDCPEEEVKLLAIERRDSYILKDGKIFTPLGDV